MCMFCRSLFVLLSFDHCVVCSSSVYGFWLHLWYLQTLLSIKPAIAFSCILLISRQIDLNTASIEITIELRCPILPASRDCPFLIVLVFFNFFVLCFMSNVDLVSGLSIHSGLSLLISLTLHLFCVLSQCWPGLWIVHSWLFLRFSLTFIVFCATVPYAQCWLGLSGLSIPDFPFGFL